MSSFCPFSSYKNILGIPRFGVHSYRFLDTAIVDYVLAIAFACLITYSTKIPLELTTIIVLLTGIILHMLFGVDTNTLRYLGYSC